MIRVLCHTELIISQRRLVVGSWLINILTISNAIGVWPEGTSFCKVIYECNFQVYATERKIITLTLLVGAISKFGRNSGANIFLSIM